MISEEARLLRGFAVDFLTSHDVAAVDWVMDPAYRLSIGGFLLDGRDDSYLPATAAQLDQFPGLCVTVHDTIIGTAGVAMRFTEHGVSQRDKVASTWGGITLFRMAGGRLSHGWAEEDYLARKRQIKSRECDAIPPPHPCPWDSPPLPPLEETESAVREWARDPGLLEGPEIEQIASGGPRFGKCVTPAEVTVSHLFTAGGRAALHLVCSGSYNGGFRDIAEDMVGTPVEVRVAGILDVAEGRVTRAQLSADRLGLHRTLLDRQRSAG
jgi:hypothetical protein